ncbi:MAG: F-type H+-transporting ATPase subunit delta [Myxococcota bacterium]|jgi:F-type H+-transporting ATPase subunit delta
MSAASKIARRYAKALVGLCNKDKSHEQTARDLDKVLKALDGAAEVEAALGSRAIPASTKKKVVQSIAKSLMLRPLTTDFLCYLADKQRTDEIRGIAANFAVRLDEIAGRVPVSVVAAKPLTTLEKQRIKSALEKVTGKTVLLEASVDAEILGGVVTRVGNIVLDGSVRTALNKMKVQLHEAVR